MINSVCADTLRAAGASSDKVGAMEINCDAGEVSREIDDAILPFVSACSVCCGAHAGDEKLIRGTIQSAIHHQVKIGAHPSWPDRENFGRRTMNLSAAQLRETLRQQILFVKSLVEEEGSELHHVKPHGALYHDVRSDESIAATLLDVVESIDPTLAIFGMPNSTLAQQCSLKGLPFVNEGFADRRYESETKLRSRSETDALISDPADFLLQLKQLVSGRVEDIHGKIHDLSIETICLHSDTANAVQFARLANDFITA